MCGIAGTFWTSPKRAIDEPTLRAMTNVLSHRGPDDSGFYYQSIAGVGGIALGHRRLSIIDLETGRQPISNEDKTVWVVFNGEIYNYRELRNNLEHQGHRFTTKSDTEVLVHLYEQYGIDFIRKLNGMFAFALWDGKANQLMLGRDRLGQKPLYFSHSDRRIAFSSQLRSLCQNANDDRDIDHAALDFFFKFGYIPQPATIYHQIKKLSPGHIIVCDAHNRLKCTSYWRPNTTADVPINRREQRLQLREKLKKSVSRRLVSDVPVGTFLSGGVDSTIIVGLARECMHRELEAFTIGFDDAEFDESSHARQIAKHLGVRHTVEIVGPSDIGSLDEVLLAFDEPFSDSSAIPTFLVSKLARTALKVVLSGDGGDELFMGYPTYKTIRVFELLDKLPATFWTSQRQKQFGPWVRWIIGSKRRVRYDALTQRMRQSRLSRYLCQNRIFSDAEIAQLYNPGFAEQVSAEHEIKHLSIIFQNNAKCDQLTQASLADLQGYLPGDILTKVDTMSMANGLECRSPFLDHEVVEFVLSLPRASKFRGMRGKHILRETFSEFFPEGSYHKRKQGFSIPLAKWLRCELKQVLCDHLLSDRLATSEFVNADFVKRMVSEHLGGHVDFSSQLWNLLSFEIWYQHRFNCGKSIVKTPVTSL